MLREEDIPQIQMPQIPRYSNVDPALLAVLGNAAQLTQNIIASPEIRERRDYNKQVRELGLQQATTERDKLQLMLEQAKIAAQTAAEQRQARHTALQGLPEDIRNVLTAGLDPNKIAAAQLLQDPKALGPLAGVSNSARAFSPEEEAARARNKDARDAALNVAQTGAANRSNRQDPLDQQYKQLRNALLAQKAEADPEDKNWHAETVYGNAASKRTDLHNKIEGGAITLRQFIQDYGTNLKEILNSNLSTTAKLERLQQLGGSLGPSAANALSQLFEGGVASTPEIEAGKANFGGDIGSLVKGYALSGFNTEKYIKKMQTALNDLESLGNSADRKMLVRPQAEISNYWHAAVRPTLSAESRQRYSDMRTAVLEEARKENKSPLQVLEGSTNISRDELTKLTLYMTAEGDLRRRKNG